MRKAPHVRSGRLIAVLAGLLPGILAAPGLARAEESTRPAPVQPAPPVEAATPPPDGPAATLPPDGARPRIGLVLGGGGAKGAAHVGVLEVLEELKVPVDCVAGTSMGALVGATFAAGVRPADIRQRVEGINWAETVGGAGLRERSPITRKLQGETYSNNLELGLRNWRLAAPGGFLRSQDIEELLRSLVAGARYIDNFDELPIPFRAVATDMMAGEMVVLGEGDLSVAMRASMAVPGAFSPVVQGDRILSDGGMMRNLPVDIARELCADVVISVNLVAPPPKPEDLASALGLASRSLDVMIDANTRAQLETLTERDVAITVHMGTIGSASFDRVPDAIPLGREAALAQQEALARYALPPAQYAAWREALDRNYTQPFRLADVEVKGLDRVNPEYVKSRVRARPGAVVSARSLEADTTRIYSLGDFERVEYRLTGDQEEPTLEITAVEKSWGPDFVRFDLGLAGSGGGELYFGLRADHRRTWLNPRGGTWHSALQVGDTSLVETSLHQPLDVQQRFFVEPLARVERVREDLYLDGDRAADYRFVQGYAQLDLGMNFGSRAQLRAGLRRGVSEAQVETGDATLPEQDSIAVTEALVSAVYDTRDRPAAATRGSLLRLDLGTSGSGLGGEYRYDFVDALVLKTLSIGGDIIYVAAGAGGELDGELSPFRQYRLGGLRSFPGLERHQLRGDKYWTATAFYNWKLTDIQPLFGQALYANVRFSAGRMGERIDGVREGTIYGASASLFGSTPIGPLSITFGGTDSGFYELQFGIGMPVSEGTIFDLLN